MKTPLQLIVLACFLTTSGAAQSAGTPVSDALRSIAQRQEKNLVAAAEEMPADKYGFKPTPEQMSFGKVIAHLAEANDYLCSKVAGVLEPKRSEVTEATAKEELVARLKETFQFCQSALAKANDSDLTTRVPFFGNSEVTRAEAMYATAEDWAGHYSQLAVYLRLNGLLPPTAKGKQG